MDHAWLVILLSGISTALSVSRRECELAGQCRNCGDGRYSYYRCTSSQVDCFPGETCARGFCCPTSASFPTVLASYEPITQKSEKSEEKGITITKDVAPAPARCPDGALSSGICLADEECEEHKEMCWESKCCRICSVRREEVMASLPTNDILGIHLPQCDSSGTFYRLRQCRPGTDDCFCVNIHGRPNGETNCEGNIRRKQPKSMERLRQELASLLAYEKASDAVCHGERKGKCPSNTADYPSDQKKTQVCNCDNDCAGAQKCCPAAGKKKVCTDPSTALTITISNPTPFFRQSCDPSEQFVSCASSCQASCLDLSALPCPSVDCKPGCHCKPGFVRRDTSPSAPCVPRAVCSSFDVSSHCTDPNRHYLSCGSACPISCDTRNSPRCVERCVSGCFCRIPFILEDGNDPLHSRCVLPSSCPPFPMPPVEFISPAPPLPVISPFFDFRPSMPPFSQRCPDPLKNFLTCGSSCPVTCMSLSPSCSPSCVAGCFCRSPYVQLSPSDIQCVLPQHCPILSTSPAPTTARSCADPRKAWSTCGANACMTSCRNPTGGNCLSGACIPGCVCRDPYVLMDPEDRSSRCVLPSECAHCEDSLKEYQRCGSSCPVGCDNRQPRTCTPCQSGCFCKNGYVFLNSTEWRTSKCIPVEECPANSTLPSTTTTELTTPVPTEAETTTTSSTTATTTTPSPPTPGQIEFNVRTVLSVCPMNTSDVGGAVCRFDTDCPSEQLCCSSNLFSFPTQRCTCPDPNAAWSLCGTLCPEYCGGPISPMCSTTCHQGCQCLPGYVRMRNDLKAPCVRRENCPRGAAGEFSADPFISHQVAIATLSSSITGRVSFNQLTERTLRVQGTFHGLPAGVHAVLVHQFGDTSANCTRLGPLLLPRTGTGLLGDVVGGQETADLLKIVEWPVEEIVGRSIGIYEESTMEWTMRTRDRPPIACATIGLTKR